MSKENPKDQPVSVPFKAVEAYLKWLSEQKQSKLQLPTMDQLKLAIDEGAIEVNQSLWTREGYIYNPNTKEFVTKPGKGMTAGFTLVYESEPTDD